MWYITERYYFIYWVNTSLWTVNIPFYPLFTPFSIAGMTKILMFDLTMALDSAIALHTNGNMRILVLESTFRLGNLPRPLINGRGKAKKLLSLRLKRKNTGMLGRKNPDFQHASIFFKHTYDKPGTIVSRQSIFCFNACDVRPLDVKVALRNFWGQWLRGSSTAQ